MKCFAYKEDGTICGRPAVVIDPQRGCAVCEVHRPGNVQEEKGKSKK